MKPIILLILLTASVALGATTKKFDVVFEDDHTGSLVCAVSFYGSVPEPRVVDKIMYDALSSCLLVDPSQDILVKPFSGEDALASPRQYAGDLVYRANDKQIKMLASGALVSGSPELRIQSSAFHWYLVSAAFGALIACLIFIALRLRGQKSAT
jgi:hypothetical protein